MVDEVDSILIDEARTPLIISGPADQATKWYVEFARLVKRLERGEADSGEGDYEVDEKKRTVGVLESGIAKVEDYLGIDNLYESVNTPLIGYLNNALKAKELFKRDKDYVNINGEILIVDEHTGRMLAGRRYNEGSRPERLPRPRFGLPSRLDTWSFVQGMTLDGLFVIGLSVLGAAALPGYAALAAGAALALRYVAEILLAPLGGGLAGRYGPRRVLTVLSVATALGLGVIGVGALWIGAVIVVVLRGLIQPIAAPVVALENPGRDRVPALARLATWRDLGAGAGPLLAGALLPVVAHEVLYGGAAALLAVSAIAVSAVAGKPVAAPIAEASATEPLPRP